MASLISYLRLFA